MIRTIEIGIAGRDRRDRYFLIINKCGAGLDIKSSVVTQNDGSIKIKADGSEEDLIRFGKNIKTGGLFSSVENFYIKWI